MLPKSHKICPNLVYQLELRITDLINSKFLLFYFKCGILVTILMHYGVFCFYQMLIYKTFKSRNCFLYIEYQPVSRTNIAIQWHLIMYINPIIKQTTLFNQNRKIKFTKEKIVTVRTWTYQLQTQHINVWLPHSSASRVVYVFGANDLVSWFVCNVDTHTKKSQTLPC